MRNFKVSLINLISYYSIGQIASVMDDDLLHMKVIFYAVSVIVVVIWALCYFVYSYEGYVHILLPIAAFIGIAGITQRD